MIINRSSIFSIVGEFKLIGLLILGILSEGL